MFDNTPVTTSMAAVAGVALAAQNVADRKAFHYVERIYDPAVHDVTDMNVKYIVPSEGELVFDVPNRRIYFVDYVDIQAGYKTHLTPWGLVLEDATTTEQDWIFGLRGGPLAGEALLSIDYSVRPNVARVDATIMRPGAAYALLFAGNDASANGTIISAVFDKSGNKLTNMIPTVLAEIVDRTNLNIMSTGQFSVTQNAEELTDGTRCTLVFYDQGGNFIPPVQPVMVQQSAYMKDHRIGMRDIDSIELISPWFTNTTDPLRLIIPVNTPVTGIEWRAQVRYSDGDAVEYAVNGAPFNLIGLTRHRPTTPGQESEITLTYALADDEQMSLANPGNPRFERVTYVIEGGAVQGAYSPRLYTYPEWDNATARWLLKHYLYDLDRQIRLDVTAKVTLNSQSPAFMPTLYGTQQALIFNLNLRDVDNRYESVIFRQFTNITLYGNVTLATKRWDVQYDFTKPVYSGLLVPVKNNGANTTFNLTMGAANQAAWLDKWYWSVGPSYNRNTEEKAPTPNAFDIMTPDGRRYRYLVANWNKDNAIAIELARGHTFFVCWVLTGSNGSELQLGMTGFTATPTT